MVGRVARNSRKRDGACREKWQRTVEGPVSGNARMAACAGFRLHRCTADCGGLAEDLLRGTGWTSPNHGEVDYSLRRPNYRPARGCAQTLPPSARPPHYTQIFSAVVLADDRRIR